MSQELALSEIRKFLKSEDPVVLSISGRWGVGKTYAWDTTLQEMRADTPLRSYAYVSAFGLNDLEALKTQIVQSTISLDGEDLQPTIKSYFDHAKSLSGLQKMVAQTLRKSVPHVNKGVSEVPYVGKILESLTPNALLRIRKQIVCIDDLERAGEGLEIDEILGFVSSLRERRDCKVVLLLNEDGLGKKGRVYRRYLEKVVEQAIRFEPTPKESAEAAFAGDDPLAPLLQANAEKLGITNIRVLRRIRRFLGAIEECFEDLEEQTIEDVVHSLTLLGWSVFEPGIAPDLNYIQKFNSYIAMLAEEGLKGKDKKSFKIIEKYGFSGFDRCDQLLLNGLRSGAFDSESLKTEFIEMNNSVLNQEAKVGIRKPWDRFRGSFKNDAEEFVSELTESVEKFGRDMSASELSLVLSYLRKLDKGDEAKRLLDLYMDIQSDRPRDFFNIHRYTIFQKLEEDVVNAFKVKLDELELEKDPVAILLQLGGAKGYNADDISFLASLSKDKFYEIFQSADGEELLELLRGGMLFDGVSGNVPGMEEIAPKVREALEDIASECELNKLRVDAFLNTN